MWFSALRFWQSKGVVKICSLIYVVKSSTPCIGRNLREPVEVPIHSFESLRSLIIDVRMFLDMVNVIEMSFEVPLLQKELSVSFQLSLKFIVCFYTWSEKEKLYYQSLIATYSKDDKTDQSLLIMTWSLESKSFRSFVAL